MFDCPGQIELYSHLDVMSRLAKAISRSGFLLCAAYCADGTFIDEPSKYISACFTALSTMTQLSVPHLNILTKIDKLKQARAKECEDDDGMDEEDKNEALID